MEGLATYTSGAIGSTLAGSTYTAGFMTEASGGRSGSGSPALLFVLFGPGTGWKYTNLLSCSACFWIWPMVSSMNATQLPSSTYGPVNLGSPGADHVGRTLDFCCTKRDYNDIKREQ